MIRYEFAEIFDYVDAMEPEEALATLARKYPDLDLDKIVIASRAIIKKDTPAYEPKNPMEYCPLCKKMHKRGTAQWDSCVARIAKEQEEKDKEMYG